jgi:hypothetical protein
LNIDTYYDIGKGALRFMNNFELNIKIENNTVTELLNKGEKRALFIYTYLLRWGRDRQFVPTSISHILTMLGKKPVASNIKTVKASIKLLNDMKLIRVFDDMMLKHEADVDSLGKNDFIYFYARESEAGDEYALLKHKYVDMTMINESELSREDMMALVLLLSRNIQRGRDNILEVTWYSMDKLVTELKIKKTRLMELIEGLKQLRIIYYDKLTFEGKVKEHCIYAMYENAEQVDMAIAKAKEIGTLNRKVKLINTKTVDDEDNYTSDDVVIYVAETDEYISDLQDRFDRMGIQLNKTSARAINKVKKEFGFKIFMDALNDLQWEISSKDNPTGYLVSQLKIRAIQAKKNNFKKI